MKIQTKKGKLILATDVTQRFTLPLNVNKKTHIVYCTYRHEIGTNIDREILDISVPDFPTVDGYQGIYSQFERYNDIGRSFGSVKGPRDYYNNSKLKKLFEKEIEPTVKAALPAYMIQLITFNSK